MADHSKHYSDSSFWKKVKDAVRGAGKAVLEKALLLYFVLQRDDLPAWAKAAIVGALGYFIFPLDALPDPIYVDDAGVLAAALTTVAMYIGKDEKRLAKEKLKDLGF